MAVSCLSNSAFIYTVYRIPELRTITNAYPVNTAVADIIFVVISGRLNYVLPYTWWVCSLYHVKEPLWFWDLQKRTAQFKFSKNLEGDLGEHLQPLLRSINFKKYREGTSQNLCKQRSGRPRTALCVSANFRTVKALWRGVNCTPNMMSSKLINEDPCSNHGLLDGVGNIINNVYSLKHVKHDKDEFIRYNCSQQIDNVNNTHLLGCCLSWSRIVNTELGKSVA